MIACLKHLGEHFSDFVYNFHYSYGSDLERYIMERNPTNSADVERLTVEYNTKQTRTYL